MSEFSNISILTLSETWLHSDIPSDMLTIENFDLIRLDRTWGGHLNVPKKGGGLCIYVNTKLHFSETILSNLNSSTSDGEIQWVQIHNKHCKNIIIANCYHPPTGNIENFVDSLEANLLAVDRAKNDIFVTGDINIALTENLCKDVKYIRSMMEQLGFVQLIKNPTRFGQTRNSLLDVIFTNSSFKYVSGSGTCDVNLCDHQMIFCTRKKVKTQKTNINFMGRSYRNYNEDLFI